MRGKGGGKTRRRHKIEPRLGRAIEQRAAAEIEGAGRKARIGQRVARTGTAATASRLARAGQRDRARAARRAQRASHAPCPQRPQRRHQPDERRTPTAAIRQPRAGGARLPAAAPAVRRAAAAAAADIAATSGRAAAPRPVRPAPATPAPPAVAARRAAIASSREQRRTERQELRHIERLCPQRQLPRPRRPRDNIPPAPAAGKVSVPNTNPSGAATRDHATNSDRRQRPQRDPAGTVAPVDQREHAIGRRRQRVADLRRRRCRQQQATSSAAIAIPRPRAARTIGAQREREQRGGQRIVARGAGGEQQDVARREQRRADRSPARSSTPAARIARHAPRPSRRRAAR